MNKYLNQAAYNKCVPLNDIIEDPDAIKNIYHVISFIEMANEYQITDEMRSTYTRNGVWKEGPLTMHFNVFR